jgi:uncharacterized lipoprotein YbaY
MGRPRFSGLATLDPAMVHWEQVPFWYSLPYDPPLTETERSSSLAALVQSDKERIEESSGEQTVDPAKGL